MKSELGAFMPRKSKPTRVPIWVNGTAWRDAVEPRRLTAMLQEMLRFEFAGVTVRKCHLYEIACARRVAHLFPGDIGSRAIEFAARAVEEPALWQSDERLGLYSEARRGLHAAFADGGAVPRDGPLAAAASFRWAECGYATKLLRLTAPGMLSALGGGGVETAHRAYGSTEHESQAQMALLRDIFGNPFQPVKCRPEWRTETAVLLARQMYESRDFGAMPILADALQDAGCTNPDILDHCRNPEQVHVRGCWVVDLVLGKA